jgi:hypothetical protein
LGAIARLKSLLETNDADAPAAYSAVDELLKGHIDPARLEELSEAVNCFDFDSALFRLREITKHYEVNCEE